MTLCQLYLMFLSIQAYLLNDLPGCQWRWSASKHKIASFQIFCSLFDLLITFLFFFTWNVIESCTNFRKKQKNPNFYHQFFWWCKWQKMVLVNIQNSKFKFELKWVWNIAQVDWKGVTKNNGDEIVHNF